MILSVTFFSLMDILVKITDEYAVGQILFFRSLFGFIPIFFLIPKNRLRNFYKTKNVSLHFWRSAFGAIAMASIFIALRNLELAETVKKIIGKDVKLELTPTNDNRSYHISSEKIKKVLGFESIHTIADAVTDLKLAFEKGLLPNSLNDEKYFNIKRMQSLNLK